MRHIKDEFNYFTLELTALLKKYGYRMDVGEDGAIVVDWFDENDHRYKGVSAQDPLNSGFIGFRPYENRKG